ncbi:MAG: hypothetical protein HeimC3_23010 [Candidatus Heimdallarchaeota archaeon LC_3]|nr:MAG: hypothetical protein HeimC3_23010 [Candidatus Heimdallarchaeota archaeon LC_3]
MEIKTLTMEHLNEVIELDQKITGKNHETYFDKHFRLQMSESHNDLMFGVYENSILQGFLIATQRQIAFGQHEEIAYLEMIEVDPEHQKQGLGTIIIKEFQKRLKNLKIDKTITMVDWKETLLLNFFNNQGFKKGDMIQLEMS